MQRILKKSGLPAFIIGLGAVLALVTTALIMAAGYRDQVHELKATLYERCQTGIVRGEALRVALDGLAGYYNDLHANLLANPSPQVQAFNDRLLARVEQVRHSLDAASALAVPASCDVYR